MPNRALLLVTGNNISTRGDTFRRVLKCRLDAKVEIPYLRTFSLNPREYCIAHRHEMVVAALTIIRAWFAAGCPPGADGRTASFEDWDRLVRQPLAWLAKSDFIQGLPESPFLCDVASVFAEAAAEAPHKEKLRAVLHAWKDSYGCDTRLSARDFTPNGPRTWNEKHHELFVLIGDAVGQRGQNVDSIAIGYWLRKHMDERIDGLWFHRDGEARGAGAYVLQCEC